MRSSLLLPSPQAASIGSPPTSTLASRAAFVCPSPSATVYVGSIVSIPVNHGLLRVRHRSAVGGDKRPWRAVVACQQRGRGSDGGAEPQARSGGVGYFDSS